MTDNQASIAAVALIAWTFIIAVIFYGIGTETTTEIYEKRIIEIRVQHLEDSK